MSTLTKDQKQFAITGALISAVAGVWLLFEGFTYGGAWRFLTGLFFVAFGVIRAIAVSRKETAEEQP
jgi:uncharacterized membrane protein HdeD (DUF308 family)